MKDGLKQLVVRLPEDLYQALRESAERNDRPLSREVRRALRLYLDTPANPVIQGSPPEAGR